MVDLHMQCLFFGLAIMICFTGVHSKNEKRLILDNEPDLDIGGEVSQLKAMVQGILKDLEVQRNATMEVKRDLEIQKSITANLVKSGSGSVYVRWGRNVCPPSTSLVYKGYTAGKHVGHKGSGTDSLCLPENPTWSRYRDGHSGCCKAYIYGTEIDTDDSQHIFSHAENQLDVPCAVCRTNKSTTVMIPARNNCYDDWGIEYRGYLMAGPDHTYGFEHICVDENPDVLAGGATNYDQHVLYLVEGMCGSLPCPPYVNGRELACVVCSK